MANLQMTIDFIRKFFTPKERRILAMFYFDNLSMRTIATQCRLKNHKSISKVIRGAEDKMRRIGLKPPLGRKRHGRIIEIPFGSNIESTADNNCYGYAH